jgi:hypothetical protein
MAASPNLLPWFETARYARLLTMRAGCEGLYKGPRRRASASELRM